MIEAHAFLERARAAGLAWYAGVPCSWMGSLIDALIADDGQGYIGAANEGDAVAIAAGAYLGGRRSAALMQNSGLGNAVSPITSLTYPFRIPVLLLVTVRGDAGHRDEPQHELMGQITCGMLEQMKVPWTDFPNDEAEIDPALESARRHFDREGRPFALVVRKGSLAPSKRATAADRAPCGGRADGAGRPRVAGDGGVRRDPGDPQGRPTRRDALHGVIDATPPDSTVVIATTGYTGRELFAIDDRPNHLYMVGSMGCASALGLGLAAARPDLRVVVIDGDGAALMRMGNLATVGASGASNLVHVVLDNAVHESTGGQPTVAGTVAFADVAAACGYTVHAGDGLQPLERALTDRTDAGARFVHVRIRRGTPADLPRPTATPSMVRERLMSHIGSAP